MLQHPRFLMTPTDSVSLPADTIYFVPCGNFRVKYAGCVAWCVKNSVVYFYRSRSRGKACAYILYIHTLFLTFDISVPNGKRPKREVRLQVVDNFQTDFPENNCFFWLSTEIPTFFWLNSELPISLFNRGCLKNAHEKGRPQSNTELFSVLIDDKREIAYTYNLNHLFRALFLFPVASNLKNLLLQFIPSDHDPDFRTKETTKQNNHVSFLQGFCISSILERQKHYSRMMRAFWAVV